MAASGRLEDNTSSARRRRAGHLAEPGRRLRVGGASEDAPGGGRGAPRRGSGMAGSTDLERTLVPEAQRFVSKLWPHSNDLQAPGSGGDLAHIPFLHGIPDALDMRRALGQAADGFGFTSQLERAPHIEVADAETGRLIGARRAAPAGRH
jgi:hypothetical protein